MTFRTTAAALAAVLLLGTASAALAYGPNACASSGNHAAYSEFYNQLTPEKQAEVDKLIKEHTDAMAQLREQLYAKRLELNALSNNANVQPEYISKLSAEIAHLSAQIRQDGQAFRDMLSEKTGFAHIPGYESGCARHGMMGYHGNGEGCARNGMMGYQGNGEGCARGGHQGASHHMGR